MKSMILLKGLQIVPTLLLTFVLLLILPAPSGESFTTRKPLPRVTVGAVRVPQAQAPHGIIKVYESTFNELADAIEPLTASGRKRVRATIGPCPFCTTITICDSVWTVDVRQLHFDINTTQVDITGEVNASWCGFSFNGNLSTTGDVTYSAGQNAVLVTTGSTSVKPFFELPVIGKINLPFTINAAPSLTLDPIPVSTALFSFKTARGPRSLRLTPKNIRLYKRDGYIELQSHATIW
jgi:hypothetical protein